MKKWTKENMKLLSKWRASKRAVASPSNQSAAPSTSMPQRQMAAMEEGSMQQPQSTQQPQPTHRPPGPPPAYEPNEPYNPMGGCCGGPAAATATGNTIKSPKTTHGPVQGAAGEYYPYDEGGRPDHWQENAPPQQQQPIHMELFHFFLRRSWKKKLFTFLVVLTVVPIVLDLFFLPNGGHVRGWLDSYLEWMADNPLLGVWTYILVLAVCSLIFVPTSILIFAAGFTFKSIWGTSGILIALIASFLGSMIGGLIGFWRARYMTRDLVEVLMHRYPIMRAVDAAVVQNGFRVMVLLRLNPLLPFGVLNYVFGITGVEWASFLLAMIGIMPWHLLLIFFGAGAEKMYDEDAPMELMEVIMISMGIAFGIIGLVITWKFAKRELQKEVDCAPPPTVADYRMADGSPRAWRSSTRKTMDVGSVRSMNSVMTVQEADLRATDYFMTQCIGMDMYEVEYGTDAKEDYQARLGWNEILLDDFS